MAKEDYLEGYGQGLKTGAEGPIKGYINKTLDIALGNPHESARRGYEQGYQEMKNAQKAEANKATTSMKSGGKVMEHKHHVDHLKQHHTEGTHKHHSEHYDAHKASHKVHHEHVKAMCKGGKAK